MWTALSFWFSDPMTNTDSESFLIIQWICLQPSGVHSGSKQNNHANIDYTNFSRVDALTRMQLQSAPACLSDMRKWDHWRNVDVGVCQIIFWKRKSSTQSVERFYLGEYIMKYSSCQRNEQSKEAQASETASESTWCRVCEFLRPRLKRRISRGKEGQSKPEVKRKKKDPG